MTAQEVESIINTYEIVAREHDNISLAAYNVLGPMFPQMREMLSAYVDSTHEAPKTVEKLMRWLGFCQGVMFLEGIYTIDEMRVHNEKGIGL